MRRLLIFVVLACATLLSGSTSAPFTRKDKAFFLDKAAIDFVRPGLVFTITGASVAQDGTITAQFTVTDPRGLGLDVQGVVTPGAIATSFVAAYIPKGQTDYVSLIGRSATGAAGTANQPAADSGGTIASNGNGQYTYTFKAKAPSNFDLNQTVSIGAWASRDLSEFGLGTNASNSVVTFVPNGSQPADIHDVVHTATCNKCHDPLEAHGGVRREVQLCVLCHNPGGNGIQTVDPDTGNSIDFKVLIHKIHMGSQLPSVQSGHPYQIIGFQGAVTDFSTVVFPADPRNCQMCHETGAPPQGGTWPPGAQSADNPAPVQGSWWLSHPTRAACGSCHDNVNFATGQNHANLPQLNDDLCSTCHFPQGELPFDISIIGAHVIPQFAPGLPGVVFTLVSVSNGTAGSNPTVTFTLNDKSGNPIAPKSMNLLNLTLAGPTADYTSELQESATSATGSNGTYMYTFQHAIPASATGTYTIGIEGYRNITLLPGTTTQQVVIDAGQNQVINFAVDNSTVTPHAVEVMNSNCNACHFSISAHGTIRNNTQYCILCHNPTATDQALRPAAQMPAQGIDFPVLIHRLHAGDQAPVGVTTPAGQTPAPAQMTPFVIYGFGGSVNNFSDVRFPGDLRDCAKCHVNGSQELPLSSAHAQVTNPRAFYSPMGPTTAACTACHTDQESVAHAQINTSQTLGESCAVCHGPNAQFSVDQVHARTL